MVYPGSVQCTKNKSINQVFLEMFIHLMDSYVHTEIFRHYGLSSQLANNYNVFILFNLQKKKILLPEKGSKSCVFKYESYITEIKRAK